MFVLEDEWLIALDLCDMLESAGFDVIGPARSVQVALALVDKEHERIEAGLLDLRLGEETSYPVAEALTGRGIPFAFLSGHSRADLELSFRDCMLIRKPVAPPELLAGLEALFQAGPPRKPAE